MAIYVSAHQKQGAATPSASDFMPYLKAWPAEETAGEGGDRYSEVDKQCLRALMS